MNRNDGLHSALRGKLNGLVQCARGYSKGGKEFILQPARFRSELLEAEPASTKGSQLDADAKPIRPKITTEEIVEIVRKGREWDRW